MYTVSARFLAGLSGVPRWQRLVEWSPDGLNWFQVTMHAGRVTQDATSQVRWSLEAEVSGVQVGRGGLSPFGSLLRVHVGMVHRPGDVEWVPLGAYRCEYVRRALHAATVRVTGSSFEAAIMDAEYPVPRILAADRASAVVASQIREVMPTASVAWRFDTDPMTYRLTTTTSRWGVIDGSKEDPSIARALGGRVSCDRNGSFIAQETPTLGDDPVWVVNEGPGGVLIESSEELTREGLFNVVAAAGEAEGDAPPVGPAIASDTDPSSPTYAWLDPGRGGMGPIVYHYTSPLLATFEACQKAAQALLAPRLGLHQQIDWRSLVNPALDAGDVVLARTVDGLTPTILDSLELDLSNMTMTGRCRATTTRLNGDVSALATSQDAS